VIVIPTGRQDLRDASFVAQYHHKAVTCSCCQRHITIDLILVGCLLQPLSSRLLGISVSPPCLSWSTGRTGGACLSFGGWVLGVGLGHGLGERGVTAYGGGLCDVRGKGGNHVISLL
jgi:hypothetical protein